MASKEVMVVRVGLTILLGGVFTLLGLLFAAFLLVVRRVEIDSLWSVTTFAVCLGSFGGAFVLAAWQKQLGLIWGLCYGVLSACVLLGVGVLLGGIPTGGQVFRLFSVLFAGVMGGFFAVLWYERKKKRH